jgi:hypothetical protein
MKTLMTTLLAAVIFVSLARSGHVDLPLGVQMAEAASCEWWQKEDGQGGCVDRCPSGEAWDRDSQTCVPRNPCPSGTIDLQGNGHNDGGDDCQTLDEISLPVFDPSACRGVETFTNDPRLGRSGGVECTIRFGDRVPFTFYPAVGAGCVRVHRDVYPRVLVGLGAAPGTDGNIHLEAQGIFGAVAGTERLAANYYHTEADDPNADTGDIGTIDTEVGNNGRRLWTAYGLYLNERTGGTGQAFDLRPYMGSASNGALTADTYPYPRYNNFVIRLFMAPVPDSARWRLGLRTLTRGGAEGPTSFSVGRARNAINRASHPDAADVFYYGRVIANGPDLQGGNTLPAFQLQFRMTWELWYELDYDIYQVVNNQYVIDNEAVTLPAPDQPIRSFISSRAWDPRQTIDDATRSIYCNGRTGAIPLPVIEAQAVLE